MWILTGFYLERKLLEKVERVEIIDPGERNGRFTSKRIPEKSTHYRPHSKTSSMPLTGRVAVFAVLVAMFMHFPIQWRDNRCWFWRKSKHFVFFLFFFHFHFISNAPSQSTGDSLWKCRWWKRIAKQRNHFKARFSISTLLQPSLRENSNLNRNRNERKKKKNKFYTKMS